MYAAHRIAEKDATAFTVPCHADADMLALGGLPLRHNAVPGQKILNRRPQAAVLSRASRSASGLPVAFYVLESVPPGFGPPELTQHRIVIDHIAARKTGRADILETNMVTVFEKLPATTLREQIARRIRQAILIGELHEGERLIERNLAGQFQTSLTAVREALIQLEADGFVVKKPNTGTHVMKLSQRGAEQIFAVRKVLETFAVEEAARLAGPNEIHAVEICYSNLLSTAESKSAQEFILKDLELHETIWRVAKNEYLEFALRRIVHPIFAFSAIRVLSRQPFDLSEDARSHLPIIHAIKSKNPKLARKVFVAAVEMWFIEMTEFVFGGSRP